MILWLDRYHVAAAWRLLHNTGLDQANISIVAILSVVGELDSPSGTAIKGLLER